MMAQDMRKVADEANIRLKQENFDSVFSMIKEAANNGKYDVIMTLDILPSTESKLATLGFKLNQSPHAYSISW